MSPDVFSALYFDNRSLFPFNMTRRKPRMPIPRHAQALLERHAKKLVPGSKALHLPSAASLSALQSTLQAAKLPSDLIPIINLRRVRWRDYFPHTWQEAVERLLPYAALGCLLAPVTTDGEQEWWVLARSNDGGERLGTWGGVRMSSV